MEHSGFLSSFNTSRLRFVQSLQGQVLARMLNSKYTISVGAQALVSGFHFVLNLVLLRVMSQYDYGVFAYAFVLGMFAQAINNALISTPLTVYTPIIKEPDERLRQEWMLGSANLILFSVLIITGLAYAAFSPQPWETSIGVTLFVAIYSARHFSRSFGYARLRPLVTATGDICYVACGAIMVAAIVLYAGNISVGLVLITLAFANLLAMVVERSFLHGSTTFRFTLASLTNYPMIWEQSRWALVGALTTLFMGQAHSLIITGTYGPSSFAPLAAGFVLFGPVRVALMTWQNMVKPEIAVALSEHRVGDVRRQIRRTSILMGTGVIAMGGMLYLFWPTIYALLYAQKYADEPMGLIVCIWAMVTFFAAIYNAPSAGLQALRDFRILAYASVYAAVISIAGVTFALLRYNPESTLYAILIAELFMAVFLLRVMYGKLQEQS